MINLVHLETLANKAAGLQEPEIEAAYKLADQIAEVILYLNSYDGVDLHRKGKAVSRYCRPIRVTTSGTIELNTWYGRWKTWDPTRHHAYGIVAELDELYKDLERIFSRRASELEYRKSLVAKIATNKPITV
jgi:hypothetical protein